LLLSTRSYNTLKINLSKNRSEKIKKTPLGAVPTDYSTKEGLLKGKPDSPYTIKFYIISVNRPGLRLHYSLKIPGESIKKYHFVPRIEREESDFGPNHKIVKILQPPALNFGEIWEQAVKWAPSENAVAKIKYDVDR